MKSPPFASSPHAMDLFDWRPVDWQPALSFAFSSATKPTASRPEAAALADTHVRIPMLGRKHSLNVATGGVALYELLRKYRARTRL
jgi:tRNA(Leu) C34 or U34 (ribose-2'-O)-methylase TrmL